MSISDAARASGLPAKTIRYYEAIGLIRPARNANGYRSFSDADIHRLAFLNRARGLGFSIEDCRALLGLYDDQDRASEDVRRLASAHLARIDARIAELRALRATVAGLVHACAGDGRPDCPILDDLADGPIRARRMPPPT
ncbi:MAG: MerR family DNA-binding protein [Rhodobacter sp.]|uniref:MerR family DNA-binding protein n=1 Tax=Pararhodobacter sp. TaxID=2127056 RepID=UPI001DBCC97A|nr:MerR family DNA-binding protein [Pararhodobacter sp.]MCB1345038.1 MerR family DNA-binding protein [Paracoccaceae bacterium]MCC0074833.1 MerR family DNA-binding protein [Rhodobacter sp.]HPD90832.1 MerR family DNA-binding protein [Pararhodobacter sp.]